MGVVKGRSEFQTILLFLPTANYLMFECIRIIKNVLLCNPFSFTFGLIAMCWELYTYLD